jgi:formylglycine-generating enzyme required for sulfatase activity
MFTANKFGLKDMLGNVWEWTCAAYPKAGDYNGLETHCTNSNDSRSRVLRGGSWNFKPRFVRSAFRFRFAATLRNNGVGFRLSRTR